MDTQVQQPTTPGHRAEEPMLGLTEKAAEKVKEIQAAENIEADVRAAPARGRRRLLGLCLRSLLRSGHRDGPHVRLARRQARRRPDVLQYLAGTTVDYVEGLQGAGFKFGNPNVKSTCGCGSSASASDVLIDIFELLVRELGAHKIDPGRGAPRALPRRRIGPRPLPGRVRRAGRVARRGRARAAAGARASRAGHAARRRHRHDRRRLPARGGIVLVDRADDQDRRDRHRRSARRRRAGRDHAASCRTRSRRRGCSIPPDPASLASCSLGGNVAENAGGPRAFKYGVTREYVLGLECVLMGGEVLRCGRRTPKGVTGYDVTAAIVGCEGTFAVATEITLKLLPKPPAVQTLLAVFRRSDRAGAAVTRAIQLGARPRALELLDRATHRSLARAHALSAARRRGRGAHRASSTAIPRGSTRSCCAAPQACEEAGAVDVLVAQNERERRDLWETRRRANPTLKELHRHKIPEDIVVPRGAIPEMLRRVDAIAARRRRPDARPTATPATATCTSTCSSTTRRSPARAPTRRSTRSCARRSTCAARSPASTASACSR